MIDQEIRTLAEQARAATGARPAPVAEILKQAGRRRTRMRAVAVAGAAAAVVLVATASALAPWPLATDGRPEFATGTPTPTTPTAPTTPTSTARPTPPSDGALRPPAGTRYVGLDGAVVAVPAAWGTNQVQCGFALAPTVIFEAGAGRRSCRIDGVPSPSLRIAPMDAGVAAGWVREATHPATIDGVPVRLGPESIGKTGLRYRSVVVPEAGVVLHVESREATSTILNTLRRLPTGWVAVPPDAWAMEAAGLAVKLVVRRSGQYSDGYVFSTDPAYGTPVPLGTVVDVVISGGQDGELSELLVRGAA